MKARKPQKKNPPTENGSCFVIMPFGGYFDIYYSDIYVPAIEAAGLSPRRADDLFRPSPIIHDIWQMTRDAKLILADLSTKNPNVFYELGLAHALSKPAILVTETMQDVPFDLKALRVLVYNKEKPDWGSELSKAITTSIKEVLKAPQNAVLPTFLNVSSSAPKPSISSQEAELLQIRQDIAALRRQVDTGGIMNYNRLLNDQYTSVRATGATQQFLDELARNAAQKGAASEAIAQLVKSARLRSQRNKTGMSGSEVANFNELVAKLANEQIAGEEQLEKRQSSIGSVKNG